MKRRSAATIVACAALAALASGCEKPLFDSDFAPTDQQSLEAGPGPRGQLIQMDEGTNQDPTVDDPDYPLPGSAPAYAEPGNAPGT